MEEILDNPREDRVPVHTPLARGLHMLEIFSVLAVILGIGFTLMGYPYAALLHLGGFIGLSVCYLLLLPIRLSGLRLALKPDYYVYYLVASIILGLVFLDMAAIAASQRYLLPITKEVLRGLLWVRNGLYLGTFLAYIYSMFMLNPAPNTGDYYIKAWITKRQFAIMILAVIGLLRL